MSGRANNRSPGEIIKISIAFVNPVRVVSETSKVSPTFTFSKVSGALKMTGNQNYYLGAESRTYDASGNPLDDLRLRRGGQPHPGDDARLLLDRLPI